MWTAVLSGLVGAGTNALAVFALDGILGARALRLAGHWRGQATLLDDGDPAVASFNHYARTYEAIAASREVIGAPGFGYATVFPAGVLAVVFTLSRSMMDGASWDGVGLASLALLLGAGAFVTGVLVHVARENVRRRYEFRTSFMVSRVGSDSLSVFWCALVAGLIGAGALVLMAVTVVTPWGRNLHQERG